MPRPWEPPAGRGTKPFSHSRWAVGDGFSLFFACSRFSSTFQHYTLQKANVLYIKKGHWGHIWRGLRQYCGLRNPQKAVEHSRFSHSRWGLWLAVSPCFSHFRGLPARSSTTPWRKQMFYTSKKVSGGIFGEV